jgi:hypothetical protein
MKRGQTCLVVSMVLGLASASAAAPIPITTCGGTIPAGQRAVLKNDVTCDYRCSGDPSIVCGYNGDSLCNGTTQGYCTADRFVLEPGATLDLNGHTIAMAYHAEGVRCGSSAGATGRCKVLGPGTFQGGKGTAIIGTNTDLVVKDVTIGRCDAAILTGGRITLKGLTLLADRENTVSGGRGISIKDSNVNGGYGIYSPGDVLVANVTLGPKAGGIAAGRTLRAHDVTLQGATALAGRDLVLRRVTTSADPAHPDEAPHLAAERRLRLVDSTVGAIESGEEPTLVRSTCETSTAYPGTAAWGVCSND